MTQKNLPLSLCLALIVFTLCQCAFAQIGDSRASAKLTADLNQKFRSFELTRLNEKNALLENQINVENPKLQLGGETIELQLQPRNLLAANYLAETTEVNGERAKISAPTIHTFKGKITGEENSQLRLTISDATVQGLIRRGGVDYFVEPARRFSKNAAETDLIVYRAEDLLNKDSLYCDLPHKVEQAAQNFLPAANQDSFAPPQTVRVVEIATEADFQFVTELGGAAAANNEILDVLNVVEGIYENQLGITFSVTYQHAWTSADPFAGGDPQSFLDSFRNYWNANFPVNAFPRDTAQLFTAKDAMRGRGQAFLSAICRPDVAYGFTGRFPYGTAKYSITAHEIAHNFNAQHSDSDSSCANTLMNSLLTTETPLTFCGTSRGEIAAYVSGNNTCIPQRLLGKTKFDFDRDSRADFAVFRPTSGDWFFLNSNLKNFKGVRFGLNGDVPVSEDFDGDRIADVAVYRAGIWYILNSADNSFRAVGFGLPTDIPVPADYNGDGRAEVAVFRPAGGFWYKLDLTNNNFSGLQFGTNGDVPTPEDYDGDGIADISVFRPATGYWYRLNSSNNQFNAAYFGKNGDRPVEADYDGDGRADVAVFRPNSGQGNWYILRSSDNGFGGAAFGYASDTPVPADYDGDGKADIAVFRTGNWYFLNSSNGAFAATQFGTGGDLAIPSK